MMFLLCGLEPLPRYEVGSHNNSFSNDDGDDDDSFITYSVRICIIFYFSLATTL